MLLAPAARAVGRAQRARDGAGQRRDAVADEGAVVGGEGVATELPTEPSSVRSVTPTAIIGRKCLRLHENY